MSILYLEPMPGASFRTPRELLSEAMRLQARAGISEMRSIVDMEAPAGTKWRTQCPPGDRPEAEGVEEISDYRNEKSRR